MAAIGPVEVRWGTGRSRRAASARTGDRPTATTACRPWRPSDPSRRAASDPSPDAGTARSAGAAASQSAARGMRAGRRPRHRAGARPRHRAGPGARHRAGRGARHRAAVGPARRPQVAGRALVAGLVGQLAGPGRQRRRQHRRAGIPPGHRGRQDRLLDRGDHQPRLSPGVRAGSPQLGEHGRRAHRGGGGVTRHRHRRPGQALLRPQRVRHDPHRQREQDERHQEPVAPVHVGLGRAAGQQAVPDAEHERGVGGVVNRPPPPSAAVRIEPTAHDARYNEQDDEVGGDRAEADVEGAERRQERNHRVEHVDALREDLGDDVDDQEGNRAEGRGPVGRLREHPVPCVQEHAVGRDEPEPGRRAQRDKREDASVEQHEVLRGGVNYMTDAGQRQERHDDDDAGDCGGVDLGRVLGRHASSGRTCMLTAVRAAASSGQQVPPRQWGQAGAYSFARPPPRRIAPPSLRHLAV